MIRFVISLLALPLVLHGTGQAGPPLQAQDQDAGARIPGEIINGTDGREVPEGLQIMLHSWSRVSGEGPMEHGVSGPGGAFTFDGIQIAPGASYVVMVLYEGAAYFSEPAVASALEPLPPFRIVVYETVADPAAVSVDSLHVIFQSAQGGLGVTEIYILSNRGDHTVADPGTEEVAPLRFRLPQEAGNVAFPGSEGGRFVLTSQGFKDTAPLVPGEASGKVAVSYVLDYQEGLRFRHGGDLPITLTNVLVPSGSGLQVSGGSVEFAGTRAVEDIGEYELYQLGPLQAGEVLELELNGTLALPARERDAELGRSTVAGRGLPLGLAALGVSLLGAGIWWWRRTSLELDEDEPLQDAPGGGP